MPDVARAEAVVGLAALGPADAELVGLARAVPLAVDELRRLHHALGDPVVRAAHLVAQQWGTSTGLPADATPALDQIAAVVELAIAHGAPPVRIEIDPALHSREVRDAIEAENWAWLTAGGFTGVVDDAREIADLKFSIFKTSNEMGCRILSRWHLARNLAWAGHRGPPVEPIPPVPDRASRARAFGLALAALDALAALPDALAEVRDWALKEVIEPLLSKEEGCESLRAELQILLPPAARSAETDMRESVEYALHSARDVRDPYLRCRALARLAERDASRRSVHVAEARRSADDLRMGSLERALALELLMLLADERSSAWQAAVAAADGLTIDHENRARLLARLARHAPREADRLRLLGDSLTAACSIDAGARKAETLSLLRVEWRFHPDFAPPGWLEDVFEDPRDRDHAWNRLTPALSMAATGDGKAPQSWAVLTLAAQVLDLLRAVAPAEDSLGLWARFGRGDDDVVERLKALGEADPLTLTIHAAAAFDQRLALGTDKISGALEVLPYVGAPARSAGAIVEGWLRHPELAVRRSAALILAEDGRIRPDTIPGLAECLEQENDRIRYRAGRVCQHPRRGRRVSALGRDTMNAIARQVAGARVPAVALAFSWLWQDIIQDDRWVFESWINSSPAAAAEGDMIAVLETIGLATPDVVDELAQALPTAPPIVQRALFKAVRRLSLNRKFRNYQERKLAGTLLEFVGRGDEMGVPSAAADALGELALTEEEERALDALAADPAVPEGGRERAMVAAARVVASAIRNHRGLLTGPYFSREAVRTRERLGVRAAELVARCRDAAGQRAAAEAVALMFLAVTAPNLPAIGFAETVPQDLDALVQVLGGDPRNTLQGLLDTERGNLVWCHPYQQMIATAAELVGRHDAALFPDLVRELMDGLARTRRGDGDYRLMTLLDVAAKAASQRPAWFNELAGDGAADLLAAAVRHHDSFPGRSAAIVLLSLIEGASVCDQLAPALDAAFLDVWHVQAGAFEAIDRLTVPRSMSKGERLVPLLVSALAGRCAIAAYAAALALSGLGADHGVKAVDRRTILSALARASRTPGARRRVFRLGANGARDGWDLYACGTLEDVLHDAMMVVSGVKSEISTIPR